MMRKVWEKLIPPATYITIQNHHLPVFITLMFIDKVACAQKVFTSFLLILKPQKLL